MALTDDTAIKALALRMIDCTLPKPEWTHEGHFALALWLCRHRRDLAEPAMIRQLITRYNVATATANTDSSGYHHSITVASMRAAAAHLDRCDTATSLAAALAALMASPLGKPDWLLQHWRRETLFSPAARRDWVEPDLAPLPF